MHRKHAGLASSHLTLRILGLLVNIHLPAALLSAKLPGPATGFTYLHVMHPVRTLAEPFRPDRTGAGRDASGGATSDMFVGPALRSGGNFSRSKRMRSGDRKICQTSGLLVGWWARQWNRV